MSTIFVTGGTGLTGANVCQQLIERGDEVRALVRNPEEAPALEAAFGPTLMAIADAAATATRPPRPTVNPTSERLGYDPMSLDDGLTLLIAWLRELGKT